MSAYKGGSIFGGLIEMAVDPSLPPEAIMVGGKMFNLGGGLRPVERWLRFGDVLRYMHYDHVYMSLGGRTVLPLDGDPVAFDMDTNERGEWRLAE